MRRRLTGMSPGDQVSKTVRDELLVARAPSWEDHDDRPGVSPLDLGGDVDPQSRGRAVEDLTLPRGLRGELALGDVGLGRLSGGGVVA